MQNSSSSVVKFAIFVFVFRSTLIKLPWSIFPLLVCDYVTGYEFDYVFDWTILKYQQAQKNRVQPHISVRMFALHYIYRGLSLLLMLQFFFHIAAGPWSK